MGWFWLVFEKPHFFKWMSWIMDTSHMLIGSFLQHSAQKLAITKTSLHKLWVVVAVSTCSIYYGQDWRLAWQSGIWCIPRWSNWEKRSDFLHLLTSQLCVHLFPMNRFAVSLILLDWKLFFVCYLNPEDLFFGNLSGSNSSCIKWRWKFISKDSNWSTTSWSNTKHKWFQ